MSYDCSKADKIDSIDKTLYEHGVDIKDLQYDVVTLKVSDAELKRDVKSLIKSVNGLADKIERFINLTIKLILAAGATGIGFIIWYIQNMPFS